MSIKLSIIIPCYNAEPYIYELLKVLDEQVTKDVEVILIDDGSKKPIESNYKWLTLIRQENGGVSKARNKGLEMAKGEIIGFIDADDLVSKNYVSYILSRAGEDWAYMDLSWKSLEDNKYIYKLRNDTDSLPNPSASTRVFKRAFIGDTRFPENKDAAEDEYFTRHLGLKDAKHVCAPDFMYFYRITTPQSTTKNYMDGKTQTKRIGYYFNHVTRDMTFLIDEIKALDETHEVFLMTKKNDIPELEKYCQVVYPRKMSVYEARGETNKYFEEEPKAIHTQVIVYTAQTTLISGIATFTYAFCKNMNEYYDITVVYNSMPPEQLSKLIPIVRCVKNNPHQTMICDTIIVNSILDTIPKNIVYKKSVQMVHCVKQQYFTIPKHRDYIVNVSGASKKSFGAEAKDGIVIHNLSVVEKTQKALLLVSSFRAGANDKQGNDDRCRKFSQLLDNAKIKYIWLYFADKPIAREPENMIYCGYKQDIKPYVAKADYMILLSGAEAYSYSLLEALELKTPVIVTPLSQNEDMRIEDGKNGYIVPFEVNEFDVEKILKVPKFEYKQDNKKIIEQWRTLLGDSKPQGDYKPVDVVVVTVIREYKDIVLDKVLRVDDIQTMQYERAMELVEKGFVQIIS